MDLQVFCRTQLVVGKRFWFFLCFILFSRFWHLHHKAILCLLVSGSSLEDVSIVFGLLYLSLLSKSYLNLWEPVPEQYLAWVITVLLYKPLKHMYRIIHGVTWCYMFSFVGWNIGSLLMTLLAFLLRSWRKLQLSFAIGSLLLVFYYFLVPESPRWLLENGKSKEAKKVLLTIAKINRTNLDDSNFLLHFEELESRMLHHRKMTSYENKM